MNHAPEPFQTTEEAGLSAAVADARNRRQICLLRYRKDSLFKYDALLQQCSTIRSLLRTCSGAHVFSLYEPIPCGQTL